MRILVIGGGGHIGGFLVPRLVREGHHVVNVSRSGRVHHRASAEWDSVEQVAADRQALDAEGTFAATVVGHSPDVVVDLVCFDRESARAIMEGLRGQVAQLLHCGSVWRYGASQRSPIVEGAGTPAFDTYGVEKEAIARLYAEETASGGLNTVTVHPGHIVGPGWAPINPLGNFDLSPWPVLSSGGVLKVPGSGAEHMHHVHADDVAQVFDLAIQHPDAAAGQDFHAVAPTALNVRGYVEIAAGWFGQEGRFETITWDEYRGLTTPEYVEASYGHLIRNHVLSIEKAQRLLGYGPRHEPDEAILESLRWLIEHGELEVPNPLVG